MQYKHPSDWYEYCRECGGLAPLVVEDELDWEPEGETWQARGWHCFACNGRVWWVKEELYEHLFLVEVPTCYQVRGKRIKIERIVDWCLLCHDTDGRLDERGDYRRMYCYECAWTLEITIGEWLWRTHGLPMLAVELIMECLGL